jgi:REP element-mobilizing transposase RayT
MSIRKVNFIPGEYYHIYNRGNDKKIIFHDNGDYNHFIKLLYLSNTNRNFKMSEVSKDVFSFDRENLLVNIGAYCLMSNHFHLLINQTENGSISRFMLKLTTAYSMYYNKKYERTGSLFQGKFKSEYVNNDIYLKYLFSYIHLNPVKILQKDWKEKGIRDKEKVLEFLSEYKHSSYLDYLEEGRIQDKILNISSFPVYFSTKDEFRKEIFEWISNKTFTP